MNSTHITLSIMKESFCSNNNWSQMARHHYIASMQLLLLYNVVALLIAFRQHSMQLLLPCNVLALLISPMQHSITSIQCCSTPYYPYAQDPRCLHCSAPMRHSSSCCHATCKVEMNAMLKLWIHFSHPSSAQGTSNDRLLYVNFEHFFILKPGHILRFVYFRFV